MVVLTIFVSAIAGTIILSGSISHGMKEIKKELHTTNLLLESITSRIDDGNEINCEVKKKLESLRKILARNFRIAFNDEEFENL